MINKKGGLNFFEKIILWLNYVAVAALLISYLAAVTDPRTFWPVAFFGLAYPPLLLVNVIFIVYWGIRKKIWVLISITAILIGWNALNNNIGLRLPSSASFVADSTRLRMMTYNVHDFKKYGSGNDIPTKHDILEIIDHEQPDIISFEEFYSRRHGQYAMVDSIKKMLKTDQGYFIPFMGSDEDGIGIAIFSKYNIVNKGMIWLSDHQNLNQCLFADVRKNGSILRVYAVHLQSIRFDPEDYQYLDGVTKKGKTDVGSSRRIGGKLKRAF